MANSRKQRRLLEKARQLESLISTYRDYCGMLLEKEDAAAQKKIESETAAIKRRLAEESFSSLDAAKVYDAVLAARTAEENRVYSELLRDAALVGRTLSDSELAHLSDVHEKRLSAIKEKCQADLRAFSDREKKDAKENRAAEIAEERIEASKKAAIHEADRKKAAIRGKYDKRIERLRKKLSAAEEALCAIKDSGSKTVLDDGVSLHVSGLKMYFGGVKAVDDLSFDGREGEIFGLIGPNGAGKTTVFNCITQFYKPTAGTLLFRAAEGKAVDLTKERVHDVILHGIVRTFQNVEVVPEISVLENLMVAGHRQFTTDLAASALHLPRMKMENEVVRNRAKKVLDFMGLTQYADFHAFGLPYGILKKIEIARTLMCAPRLIILDEPAAGLNDTETAELAGLIRRIRDEFNCTVLLVEHDMGLVMDVCDNICAIAFGKLLAYGTPAEIQANRDVQQAYLGVDEEGE